MTTNLILCERLHQEAACEHVAASAQAQQNRDRLNDAKSRQEAITARRIEGTASDRDTAEFAALGGDIEVLKKMLTAAQQAANLAAEKMHAAFVEYTDAQAAHNRELAEAKYRALVEKCKEIEAVFCRCLGEVARAGQAIGISTLGQAYKRSDTLHRALDLNISPPVES